LLSIRAGFFTAAFTDRQPRRIGKLDNTVITLGHAAHGDGVDVKRDDIYYDFALAISRFLNSI
jgi:hypothetical protein